MLAVRIHETGGPEKLRTDEVSLPQPGPGEIRLRVEAAGINFVDTYHRTGLYPSEMPHVLGSEAAGVVTAVGEGVTEFRVGDRVASPRAVGGYAEETLAPASHTVLIPAAVSFQIAAAVLLQGLTAHYLATDTYPLKPGDSALVHAGAGGVGLLLIQIARIRGARVIATVGSDAKVGLAREAGAEQVCNYSRDDFSKAARAFTKAQGVDVAYDSVGKNTFEGTLDSLRPRGMFVSFGNASGPVPPFSPLVLAKKGSLFLTRPTLNHYIRTPAELRARTDELFSWIASGRLKVRIGATFPLAAAGDAHRALESRTTTGKLLLLPSGNRNP
ncbi:MAG: Alcohol dehydrogenase zinc-binding domain protein [Verrucomicrobia bacterium]|nr:Alcohol dehydrogenase zinc-binding domain protein [Verrucomicrobiota bacterium]